MKIFLVLSLSLISFHSMAYEVFFGEAEKAAKGNSINILGAIDKNIFIYRFKPMPLGVEKHTITKYDPGTLQSTQEIKLEIKRKNLERMVIFNGNILIFQSEKDSRSGTQRVWYDIYDANSLTLSKGNNELVSIEYKKGLFSKLNAFKIITSEDESKIAIYYDLPYEKGAPEKFGFVIYDQDMKELYSNQTALPVNDELMTVGGPHISNEGKFYISARETTEKGLFGNPKASLQHIYLVTETGGLVDHQLTLPDKFIIEYIYSTNENGELICSGLFGTQKRGDAVSGGFYIRLDKETSEVAQADYTDFPDEFITSGWSERAKKKAEKNADKGKGGPNLYNYDIRQLVTLDNGGAVLVAEQFYIRVVTTVDANGNRRTTYYYYYNDIIVLKLNGEGKFDWYAKVPKYQVSVNDGGYYSSFSFHAAKDKLYIMFNDNMKNYVDGNVVGGKTYPTSFTSNKNNVTSLVDIAYADGSAHKNQLFSKAELGTIAVPKIHFSDRKANLLYILSKKKSNERVGKIVF